MGVTIWLVEVPMSTSSFTHLVGAGEYAPNVNANLPLLPPSCCHSSSDRHFLRTDERVSRGSRIMRRQRHDLLTLAAPGVPLNDFAILALASSGERASLVHVAA